MWRVHRLLLTAAVAGLALSGCARGVVGTPVADVARTPGASDELRDLADSMETRIAAAKSVHLTASANYDGIETTGGGGLTVDGARIGSLTMELTTTQGPVDLIYLDDVLYFSTREQIEPGRPWLKVTADDDSPDADGLNAYLDSILGLTDPRATLDAIAVAGVLVAKTDETVDGRATTHFSILVNLRALADEEPDPDLADEYDDLARTMPNYPVDLWVDTDGLPVRLVGVDPMADDGADAASSGQRIDYTNWGEPLTVTSPPAEQIAELPG